MVSPKVHTWKQQSKISLNKKVLPFWFQNDLKSVLFVEPVCLVLIQDQSPPESVKKLTVLTPSLLSIPSDTPKKRKSSSKVKTSVKMSSMLLFTKDKLLILMKCMWKLIVQSEQGRRSWELFFIARSKEVLILLMMGVCRS